MYYQWVLSAKFKSTLSQHRKTIAGDYMVAISASPESGYAFGNIDVRVTVLTPTIWGWVGIGIVVLVIAGLAVMFMRLGRR